MNNKNEVRQKAKAITNAVDVLDLAKLLHYTQKELMLISLQPFYYQFTVPKKNGGERCIEAPDESLKKLQRKLNVFLNAIYYEQQSDAAHGYVMSVRGEKRKKNIYTNAVAHLHKPYMMNMDFKDFFHQISQSSIVSLFKNFPFQFDKQAAMLLGRICTFKKRLPMGAPTSPALSNLYTIVMDKQLTAWSLDHHFIYTRYVDDLVFSCEHTPLGEEHIIQIKEIANEHNLSFNNAKTKIYGPQDKKTITGLELNETIDIPIKFYKELDKNLTRLKSVYEVMAFTREQRSLNFLRAFKQEIMGQINFIGTIEGYKSQQYLSYFAKFNESINPPDDLIVQWTQFGNYY